MTPLHIRSHADTSAAESKEGGSWDELIDPVWDALGQVMDPELGVPITELGLVYRIEIEEGVVDVTITTTTPVCPLGGYITMEIEKGVLPIEGVRSVQVQIVHEPLWTPERMSNRAKQLLGWYG